MITCDTVQRAPVIVVGDDNDFLVLLFNHFAPDRHNHIYLQTHSKGSSFPFYEPAWTQLSEIQSYLSIMGHYRALSGCDTNSRLYGIRNLSAIAKHHALGRYTAIFMASDRSRDTIEEAAHQALATLYDC